MTTRVLLVGTMGTGKSTVGAALSELTGWPHLDNDGLLQRTAGLSAPDLLDEQDIVWLVDLLLEGYPKP